MVMLYRIWGMTLFLCIYKRAFFMSSFSNLSIYFRTFPYYVNITTCIQSLPYLHFKQQHYKPWLNKRFKFGNFVKLSTCNLIPWEIWGAFSWSPWYTWTLSYCRYQQCLRQSDCLEVSNVVLGCERHFTIITRHFNLSMLSISLRS